MKCPVDKSQLQINSRESAVGYCCNVCNGILLTEKEISTFQYNFQTDILENLFAQSAKSYSDCFCPICENNMVVLPIDEMEIIACSKCKSLWFKKGLMLELLEKYSPDFKPRKQSVLEIISDWIFWIIPHLLLPIIFGLFYIWFKL